ncbi:BCCT family transporter [Rappaport israeli]|uniref:BCCT family transporter n=1 Tax=Rappaport israeli TaxID=1839807 RepID=UPI0009317186|nr:BCCT family transporter [Rappaport israeli]
MEKSNNEQSATAAIFAILNTLPMAKVVALCLMPVVLLFTSGDLVTLQTASIFAGAPLIVIMSMMMAATIKAVYYDLHYQLDYSLKTIYVDAIPEVSSWEIGDTSLAPEGSVHAELAEYEQARAQDESNEAKE